MKVFFFSLVVNVIVMDKTEGGTLSKPAAGVHMPVGVLSSCSMERFIDCRLQVRCPVLDSLDCLMLIAILEPERCRDLMPRWSNVTALSYLKWLLSLCVINCCSVSHKSTHLNTSRYPVTTIPRWDECVIGWFVFIPSNTSIMKKQMNVVTQPWTER